MPSIVSKGWHLPKAWTDAVEDRIDHGVSLRHWSLDYFKSVHFICTQHPMPCSLAFSKSPWDLIGQDSHSQFTDEQEKNVQMFRKLKPWTWVMRLSSIRDKPGTLSVGVPTWSTYKASVSFMKQDEHIKKGLSLELQRCVCG